jgi:hypothetical protein
MAPGRRVGIAFDDGPLEPSPTWYWLDDESGGIFPPQFVAGYDTSNGRQTLISQTETGTAKVYVNDRAGLLDDRNLSSPFVGKLSGRQVLLQLWNPVTAAWEPQFRGLDRRLQLRHRRVRRRRERRPDQRQHPDRLRRHLRLPQRVRAHARPGRRHASPAPRTASGTRPTSGGPSTTGSSRSSPTSGSTGDVRPRRRERQGHRRQVRPRRVRARRSPRRLPTPSFRSSRTCTWTGFGHVLLPRPLQPLRPRRRRRGAGLDWDFTRWKLGDGNAIEADPTRGRT